LSEQLLGIKPTRKDAKRLSRNTGIIQRLGMELIPTWAKDILMNLSRQYLKDKKDTGPEKKTQTGKGTQ
jgi:hypothetical protein